MYRLSGTVGKSFYLFFGHLEPFAWLHSLGLCILLSSLLSSFIA